MFSLELVGAEQLLLEVKIVNVLIKNTFNIHSYLHTKLMLLMNFNHIIKNNT